MSKPFHLLNFYIKKCDIFFLGLIGKVNTRIKFMKTVEKISQFFTMCSYEENIDVSGP